MTDEDREILELVGGIIDRGRRARGLTIADLAEHVGVSHRTMVSILNGESNSGFLHVMRALAGVGEDIQIGEAP